MDYRLVKSSGAGWLDLVTIDAEKLQISFRRTIKVPDNDDTSLLPPNLGTFPLYSVDALDEKLPDGMATKGGILFPIHSGAFNKYWTLLKLANTLM